MIKKRTKVIATLGPASDSKENIERLIRAGVNVFRFNMKHADVAWHNERINRVQRIANLLHASIGILIDLQGPEIRIETFDKASIEVKQGETITFAEHLVKKDPRIVSIPHAIVFDVLEPRDPLLLDDGFLELTIESIDRKRRMLVARANDDCVIKHRKGVNIPGKDLPLPSLIADDLKKLDMAARSKVDFVALSFSRTKDDIDVLRKEMKKRQVDAMIVAKVESQQALDHLDELIDAADAIMVARGDLGIEVPIEELAYWQKKIITKCRAAHKPVITATQMLQSMIDNPRPTRAEATDVANAVFDGTDAIMLSGETATGKYPVKAVAEMTRIAAFNERHTHLQKQKVLRPDFTTLTVEAALAIAEEGTGHTIDVLLVFTETGKSARVLSSFRPDLPIIAVTDQKKTIETLTLSYGVTAHHTHFPTGAFHSPHRFIEKLVDEGLLHRGQTIVVIHGRQWKTPGLTNAVTLLTV